MRVDALKLAFNTIHEPGAVVEVRAFGELSRYNKKVWEGYASGLVTGYFDNAEDFAQRCSDLDNTGKPEAVYMTLNPLNPALLNRAKNKLKGGKKGTSTAGDEDVLGRRWLFVDLDADRPKGISSTDDEKAHTKATATKIVSWLSQTYSWPSPVEADSGNGTHLLYRINLPNTPDARDLVRDVLKSLKEQFDNAHVNIDEKVFNAARITKAYGTTARKGDDTSDRPHRGSGLLSIPDDLGVVTIEQLEEVAKIARMKEAKTPAKTLTAGGSTWTIAELVDEALAKVAGGEYRNNTVIWLACQIRDERYSQDEALAGCRDYAARVPDPGSFPDHEVTNAVDQAYKTAPREPRHPKHTGSTYNGFGPTPDGGLPAEDAGGKRSTFPYAESGGRIVYIVESADPEKDDKLIPVADFTARIVEEIHVEGDGAIWRIAGEALRGGEFECEIPADDFSDDRLLKKTLEAAAGPRDPVLAGQTKHLGPAVKRLTGDVVHTKRYTRTGWADGRFLIPGREPENVTISLPRKLPYAVGDGNLSKGIESLRSLCDGIGAERATVILAALLSGPMALPAGWRNERYALFVRGRTGTLKTSTLQTAMSMYGGFMRDELLTKWGEGATSNAIMALATAAHDLPFLIDNYKPSTGGGDRAFVGLVHNILEGGEKDRLNRASELRESKPVHCWPVFTGEDAPTTDAAALARCLIVPFTEIQTQQNNALALAQEAAEAGHIAAVGRAWIEWLESADGQNTAGVIGRQLSERRAKWADFLRSKRKDAVNILRIATNLATNQLAFEAAVQSPICGFFTANLADIHRRALEDVAVEMGNASSTALEALRFIEGLQEILAVGRYRLADSEMGEAEANSLFNDGRLLGWKASEREGGGAFFFSKITRQAVETVTGPLGYVSDATLYSQLTGLGYLLTKDDSRGTVVKRWAGQQYRVLHLTPAALSEGATETESVTA